MKAITKDIAEKKKFIFLTRNDFYEYNKSRIRHIKPFDILSGTDFITDNSDYECQMVIYFSIKYPNKIKEITE